MIVVTSTRPTAPSKPARIHAWRAVQNDRVIAECGYRFDRDTVTVTEADPSAVTCGTCLDHLDHDRVYIGPV